MVLAGPVPKGMRGKISTAHPNPDGQKNDGLFPIKRLDLLRVHILNVVDLAKRWADKHRQPNEKQTQSSENRRAFRGNS